MITSSSPPLHPPHLRLVDLSDGVQSQHEQLKLIFYSFLKLIFFFLDKIRLLGMKEISAANKFQHNLLKWLLSSSNSILEIILSGTPHAIYHAACISSSEHQSLARRPHGAEQSWRPEVIMSVLPQPHSALQMSPRAAPSTSISCERRTDCPLLSL